MMSSGIGESSPGISIAPKAHEATQIPQLTQAEGSTSAIISLTCRGRPLSNETSTGVSNARRGTMDKAS